MFLPPLAAITAVVLILAGEPLKVAAAISLRDVLSELADRFEKSGGPHVDWAFGSSGQLVEQVRQGAPLDAIIVANREFANALENEKLVESHKFIVIAGNRIVLTAPRNAKAPPKSFEDLLDARFKRIAIGDPATVPVGDYAIQVLRSLKLDEKLKDKLVYGTNARQVLSYLQSGEVNAGIVFSTDAMIAADSVQVIQPASEAWHNPVEYLAAPIHGRKNANDAAAFLQFLCSDESQRCFVQMGFLPRENQGGSAQQPAPSKPTTQAARRQASTPASNPASSPAGVRP